MYRVTRRLLLAAIVAAVALSVLIALRPASAQNGEFYLQVSPSPLVSTLKPGQATTLELKIRNAGTQTENLKIAPRSFKITQDQQFELDDTKQPEVAGWIKFSEPRFTVKAGQTYTQRVTINVPKEAGFSYSFILLINRADDIQPEDGSAALKGSVALFTLLNIDRPGATRQLEVAKFTTSKGVYEYLPTEFDIDFKNTGNTIVQPAGSLFVQRSSNDQNPLGTLAVNDSNGYILPGTTRTLRVNWEDGFPVTRTTTGPDGKTSNHTDWNWNNIGNIRFGKYTAKLVAIYNDGQRDVPVLAEVTFWVIPWKIMLGVLVVILLVGFGIWSFVIKAVRLGRRIKR